MLQALEGEAMRSIIWLSALLFAPGVAQAQSVCQAIAGASIVADDGTYLGRIESQYATESVLNEYGSYGSQYASKSIWNQYGSYGGEYASQSPFNPYTSTPPMIIKDGRVIAFLSINQSKSGALNPYVIKSCTFY